MCAYPHILTLNLHYHYSTSNMSHIHALCLLHLRGISYNHSYNVLAIKYNTRSRARLGQVKRVTRSEADTGEEECARVRQTQQQASTPEWSRISVQFQLPSTLDMGTMHVQFPLQCPVMLTHIFLHVTLFITNFVIMHMWLCVCSNCTTLYSISFKCVTTR